MAAIRLTSCFVHRCFCYHVVNCHDDPGYPNRVVVDVCKADATNALGMAKGFEAGVSGYGEDEAENSEANGEALPLMLVPEDGASLSAPYTLETSHFRVTASRAVPSSKASHRRISSDAAFRGASQWRSLMPPLSSPAGTQTRLEDRRDSGGWGCSQ